MGVFFPELAHLAPPGNLVVQIALYSGPHKKGKNIIKGAVENAVYSSEEKTKLRQLRWEKSNSKITSLVTIRWI